jgi:hypothetical protein
VLHAMQRTRDVRLACQTDHAIQPQGCAHGDTDSV